MSRIIDWISSRLSGRGEESVAPTKSREFNPGEPRAVRYTSQQASALMPDIYKDFDETVPDLEIIQEPLDMSEGFNPYDTSRLHVRDGGKD